MYKCIFRDLDQEVFHSEVQICTYPNMSMIQEGQAIPRDQWIHWDAESSAQQAVQEVQGSDIDTASNSSENTILYDIDSDMIIDHDIVDSESVNTNNELPDINQLRAELAVLGGSDSSPPNFVMPTNYTPASPRYSPVSSPAYSPSQSPINIDTDSEHGNTPPQNDAPIVTRASEIFDLPNDDSDIELYREVELINMMGSYVNRNRLPIQINGVYIFPQSNNIHDLRWEEYPDEACSDHCIIPRNTDKTFPRFYLTHSLCLKHRSTLTTLGPWIYITSKVSTLTKLYRCPQITHFITLLNQNMRRDQRVKEFLAACHLTENSGSCTLLIRFDVYMTNNPLECRYWTQAYSVDDHVTFGEKTLYYLQRDFMDMVYDLKTER